MRVPLFCAFAAMLPGAFSAHGGVLDWLFSRNEIDVISVTDMTPEGRNQRTPTPENPVYYVAISLGFQDLGGLVGGEKPPPKEDVIRQISTALAKQGYLPATEASPPPTLALAFAWGTLNADYDYGFNPDLPPRQRNQHQILKFLGGYKIGFSKNDFDPLTPSSLGFALMNIDTQAFYELAREDFYVAVVSAYDLATIKDKKKRLLWMTRISCPSSGYFLPDVLPMMMALGGPNFGRESDRPAWHRASDKYRPEVKLRELELLEYLGEGPLTVVDAPTNKAKKPAKKK
ncbi:MAG: hypothetical protein PSV13_01315 [Lacunisphaera sp.]|nr:hypothetical protein [Lacunisphaera sp.]